MNIFVVDPHVAAALCPDADWQACDLQGFDTDSVGCVCAAEGQVSGVCAPVTDRSAIDAYFCLFSGAWVDVLNSSESVQAFASDQRSAPFGESARALEALIARDIADIVAAPTRANHPINRTGLVMRARSSLRAVRDAAPVSLRKGFSRADVTVTGRKLPYSKYFDVEDITLTHGRFGGDTSDPMARAVFRSADAVTVLPYDPVLDQIVLVEQFRPGAFVRGDSHPWVLEPVAGRCDGDEPVETVAEREMVEEAGLKLLSLHSIGNYYPSPGCLSEYLYSFVGLVDLSKADTGVHGLDTENEDIRTHFVSFDAAMALIETGEADNGPLLLSLYWLAANRARLREAASAA